MEDVSELFKRHFNLLHKGTAISKTVQDRKDVINNARKAKRDTLAYLRRNINENMSPIPTPTPAKRSHAEKTIGKTMQVTTTGSKNPVTTTTSKPEGVNKRLELLKKWKADKEKTKEQAKANAKPIFKVCRVPTETTTHLDNAIKLIKGKPIPPLAKAKFAPPNHKFKPPTGIKPIVFTTGATKKEVFPVSSLIESDRPTSSKFNKDSGDGLVEEVKKRTASASNKKTNKIVNNKRHDSESAGPSNRITRSNANKAALEKTAAPKASSQNPQKKTIGWSVSKKGDSTQRTREDRDSSNKVTYRKTPKKSKGLENKRNKDLPVVEPHLPIVEPTLPVVEPTLPVVEPTLPIVDDDQQPGAQQIEVLVAGSSSSSTDYSVDYDNCSNAPHSADSVFGNNSCSSAPQFHGAAFAFETPPLYVSPFVTISRGKDLARKEFKLRHSQNLDAEFNNTPEAKKILSAHTSPVAGAAYFKRKLEIEFKRISEIRCKWETYLEGPDVPEEACSSINCALGQSKLLITKKFQQFRGLIQECETENFKLKPVTCEDLHGYWDMLYMQVDDVDKRFANLQSLKDNNWEEILPVKVAPVKRTRGRPKKVQTKSKIMQLIQEAKKNRPVQEADHVDLINNLDYAKILSTDTPSKERPPVEGSDSRKRRSIRISILKETQSRCSSSPGLTMMKVSQSIKQGDGLTPVRSILKTDLHKSTGKKSVVFNENLVTSTRPLVKTNLFCDIDKENVSKDLISFNPAPVTPRRSTRRFKN